MSECFAELFEASQVGLKMRPGEIISAMVEEIGRDIVTVNAGLKSEGFIPISQFLNEKGELEIAVGDKVDVALDTVEDGYGETKLSREKVKRLMIWHDLEAAYENNTTITGLITERIKGGFNVDINGIKAFLPGSLVDVRPAKDNSHLEGKEAEFKLIKVDRHKNNVIVSRRAVIETENTLERAELLASLKVGMIVKGVVKNVTDYGAFMDLGGIDGLLHITDMAWQRVKNPGEVVSVGDAIEVKVLNFDRERARVSLGLKQMTDDPWIGLAERYSQGDRLRGKVTNITDYGCFIELETGVEGLVHMSEMDWTNKNIYPAKLVQTGEEIEVAVLDIDAERHRISLGMKQCQPNPWEEFATKYDCGDQVTGVIKSITDFGIFVCVEGNIDGLVHRSDITWSGRGEEIHNYNKGDTVESVVLSVDPLKERISLGIKQMKEDPFPNYIAENPKGSVVKGTIVEVTKKYAMVRLTPDIESQMRATEISRDIKVEDARSTLKLGDEIEVKITAVDRKKRTLSVSARAKELAEEAAAVEAYSADADSDAAIGTIGDLMQDHPNK